MVDENVSILHDNEQDKHPGGRPIFYTKEEKQKVLAKLEPHLKSGLSTRKALLESEIHSGTFYRLMNEDEEFREQIERYRHFPSILLNNAIMRHLSDIIQKQQSKDKEGKSVLLTGKEINFLQWFALNSNLTKQEYGERKDISMFDAEAEIQKVKGILEEKTTKELPPIPK